MLKRIAALTFIFVCTSFAWIVLGTTIFHRTYSSNAHLRGLVASIWGGPHEQHPPSATTAMAPFSPGTHQDRGRHRFGASAEGTALVQHL